MAIIIENFNTDSPKVKQKKSEVEKQEYLKFLIEKGIEETLNIAKAQKAVKELMERSAVGQEGEFNKDIEYLEANIFYYEEILPALIAGDYEAVQEYSILPINELKDNSREIRRRIIAALDEKYGHLY